jgi:single-strand DNA-binding protein
MYLNKVTIIGNVTKDPEVKALPNGSKVANFSVATNRTWKDKEGVKKEEVEFHNVVAFGVQADLIERYVKKGSQLYVEGRLQTRSWETDGKKNYKTEIVMENMQFGNKAKEEPKMSDEEAEKRFKEINGEPVENTDKDYPTDDINPEDIPF